MGFGIASAADAEIVRLTSIDGGTTLTGDFISFDGQVYTIRTIVGEFTVDAFQVTCAGAACPVVSTGSESFRISGSSTLVGELFANLMFDFGASIGGTALTSMGEGGASMIQLQNEAGTELAQIALNPGTSANGLAEVVAGTAALAVTTRPVTQTEVAAFRNAGLGNPADAEQEKIFALDGLVVVTSQNNPLRAIAEQDLARIFSGEIGNWDQIGGPSANINIYARAEDSGTGMVIDELVMAPAGRKLSPAAKRVETDADLAKAVASDPLGIGITGLATKGAAKVLAIRGVCGIQVPATPFTIKTEEYPLSRRIFAYNGNKDLPAQLGRFLKFLDTDAAQSVIADAGFVDLGASFQSNNEQGLRYLSAVMPTDVEVTLPQLQEMTQALTAADRSSITFRFALGSARLDARAQDDILRLANLIATGDITNKELLLIGFTDSIGPGQSNLGLSAQRANEVRQALEAAAPPGSLAGLPITALGFGEISPLSCNETANGRRINRRVEVWLRDLVTVAR